MGWKCINPQLDTNLVSRSSPGNHQVRYLGLNYPRNLSVLEHALMQVAKAKLNKNVTQNSEFERNQTAHFENPCKSNSKVLLTSQFEHETTHQWQWRAPSVHSSSSSLDSPPASIAWNPVSHRTQILCGSDSKDQTRCSLTILLRASAACP